MAEIKNHLLLSKNRHLFNLLDQEGYNVAWFSADLNLLSNAFQKDTVIIYDTSTHGVNHLRNSWLLQHPMVILGEYEKNVFVDYLLEAEQKAYLLIDDFIQELPDAIACIQCGKNYVTRKIALSVKNAKCNNQP